MKGRLCSKNSWLPSWLKTAFNKSLNLSLFHCCQLYNGLVTLLFKVHCVIVSPRNVESYTHKVSKNWLPKQELNRDKNNRHAKVEIGKLIRPHIYTNTYRQQRKVKAGPIVFSNKEHTNWLSKTRWSALKICIKIA